MLAGMFWTSTLRALEYEYDAPAECPTRAAFLEEVQSRLRHPAEQSTVERLRVTVRRHEGFQAGFVLIEPGQPPVSRALTAEACDEAVRALALGAALALDARYREVQGIPEVAPEEPVPSVPTQATTGSQVTGSSVVASAPAIPAAPPPATPASVAAVVQPPAIERPPPAAAPAATVRLDEPPSDRESEPSEPEAQTLAARVGAFGATGYAPDPSFGPSLAVVARNNRFALELEAFVGAENRAGNGEQSAEFWVIGGRLVPCARWPLPGRFGLKSCALVELSGVHAEGVDSTDVARTAEDWVPYWALGALLGAEAPVTQALSVGLDLGVQFPLSERSFYFKSANGNVELHEYPRVAARGQLAVCYAF